MNVGSCESSNVKQLERFFIFNETFTNLVYKWELEVFYFFFFVQFGPLFVQTCDFMLGSPTALADPEIEDQLFKAAKVSGDSHSLSWQAGSAP